MGLGVWTHGFANALADSPPERLDHLRDQLRSLNDLLLGEGFLPHHEATARGAAAERDQMGGVPYSFLHHLRRAYARAHKYPDEPLMPAAEDEDPADDEAVVDLSYTFESHLLCHSDCEGYYVPVDFGEVLFPDEELALSGGMVGSSQALMRELVYVAPYLGIAFVDGELLDAEIDRIHDDGRDEHSLYRERLAWLLLYEAARVSVANSTIITFG
ncbi:hypothetical protein [Nocardia sp. CDC160]|uniref:hypothetical protein n=1 Tax=Nocardia sp. CDC160 TaxID=3112166 RepID=UPI002DBDF304|nr:hypothetical protein [Nocardia sp. CDC160]MEC3919272.1 hypothetical protein [Nocardia sp. CDC160]